MKSGIAQSQVPALRRQDISWRTVGAVVEIQIDLANGSPEPTEDAELVIEAAAFGAFVPFEPITRVAVAGLSPYERRRVLVTIAREQLDAVSELRPLLEKSKGFHWAGNLSLYFDRAPEDAVELHRAFDLSVEAGRRLEFEFVLGPDQYSMEVRSSDVAWGAEVVIARGGLGFVFLNAPSQAGLQATIEVLVTRLDDGKTVPVEFSMQTVEGPGDPLGCVQA